MSGDALENGKVILPSQDHKEAVTSFKAARNCVFTLNNYTEADLTAIGVWECKYLTYGKEVGESGNPHLQGYVEWKRPKEWKTLKNLHPRIHWEARKGSQEQAINYCRKGAQTHDEWKAAGTNGPNFGKDAQLYERGDRAEPGKRTDLEDVGSMALAGVPIAEIAAKHPVQMILYGKGIEKLIESQYKPRAAAPYVEWRWGPSGRGKSEEPAIRHKDSYYIKDATMWWPSYTQQEAIIIDDFDGKWPFRDLLRLLDQYPYQGQTKGGYIHINSPYIYITCEYPPEHFWGLTSTSVGGNANELEQIRRRIDKVVECKYDATKIKPRRKAPAPKVQGKK